MKRAALLCLCALMLMLLPACGQRGGAPTTGEAEGSAPPAAPSPSASAAGGGEEPGPAEGQTAESEHFLLFHDGEDPQTVEAILDALEEHYEKISDTLQATPPSQSYVFVYPDLAAYHAAVNQPDAADWNVASYYMGAIHMVSPDNPGSVHSYDGMLQVTVHEFVHLVANRKLNDRVPPYLAEGLATYLTGQTEGMAETYTQAMEAGAFPTSEQLPDLTTDTGAYPFGSMFAEYVVQAYGWEKLVEFYKHPQEFDAVFDTTREAFDEAWMAYLAGVYGQEAGQ